MNEEIVDKILQDAENSLTELVGRLQAQRLLHIFEELELPEKLFDAGFKEGKEV